MSVNILKSLETVEKAETPDLKSMTIADRSKYWKEQKEKKIEEQRKAKKDQELDGCTFKPKKKFDDEVEISKRLQPGKATYEKKSVVYEKALPDPPVKKISTMDKVKQTNEGIEYNNIAFMLKGADLPKTTKESALPTKLGTVKLSADRPAKPSTGKSDTIKPNIVTESAMHLSASPPVRIKPGFLSEMSKPRGK